MVFLTFFLREIVLRRWRKVEVDREKEEKRSKVSEEEEEEEEDRSEFFSLGWIYGGKGKTRIFILLSLQPISSALTSQTTVCPHVSLK